MNDFAYHKSVRRRHAGRFFLLLAAFTTFSACNQQAEPPIQLLGQAQGSYYSIAYYDPQHRDLQKQIDSLLNAFDQSASLWIDSSLIRKVNDGTTDSLDTVLLALLNHSLEIMDSTHCAFDCRVGRLVQARGFSFKSRSEPDSAALAQLLRASKGTVEIKNGRLARQYPDTELDFNAIAQGYSVDMVGAFLECNGIANYLVDIGGEVLAHGTKSNGADWIVGIEKPAADSISAPIVQTAIALRDASVVTSGSYRKYYERNGMKYSHTIDPTTGRPVQHSLLSVSVVDKESWLADAMATAYMVMGLDSSLAFINSHPKCRGTQAVFFIYDDHGTLCTHATPQFEQMIIKQ